MAISRGSIWIILSVVGVVLLGAAWWCWALLQLFEHGETTIEPIGGHWQVRHIDSPMDHSGGQETLERLRGDKVIVVGPVLQLFRYMDDDCVLYEVSQGGYGPQHFAACGDHPPIPLTEPGYDEWLLLPDGLQRIEWIGDTKRPTQKLLWPDIKARAEAPAGRSVASPPSSQL